MQKKKVIIFSLAFLALFGMINCTVIEPAHACKDSKSAVQTGEEHCCLICHSAHHQWAPAENEILFSLPLIKRDIAPDVSALHIGSFVSSIFHPPQLAVL